MCERVCVCAGAFVCVRLSYKQVMYLILKDVLLRDVEICS